MYIPLQWSIHLTDDWCHMSSHTVRLEISSTFKEKLEHISLFFAVELFF